MVKAQPEEMSFYRTLATVYSVLGFSEERLKYVANKIDMGQSRIIRNARLLSGLTDIAACAALGSKIVPHLNPPQGSLDATLFGAIVGTFVGVGYELSRNLVGENYHATPHATLVETVLDPFLGRVRK